MGIAYRVERSLGSLGHRLDCECLADSGLTTGAISREDSHKNLLEEDVQSSALSFNKIIEVYVSVAGQTSVSNSEDYFFLVVGDLQAVK
jgi:hypothetical protein